MEMFGNICGGLFALVVLAALYLVAGNMLGIIGKLEEWSPDYELLAAERLLLLLPGLPPVVRWGLFLIGPLVISLIGAVLIIEAIIRLESDLVEMKSRRVRGSAR